MRRYNAHKLKIAKKIDRILSLFVKMAQHNSNINKLSSQRILICEYFLLGDLIMALPAFRAIRNKFPYSKLILLSSKYGGQLVGPENIFDEIITFKCPWAYYDHSLRNIFSLLGLIIRLRKYKFDLAVDLRGDLRNNLLMHLIGAKRRVGYDVAGGGPFLTDIVPYNASLRHQAEGNNEIAAFLGAKIENLSPSIELRDEEKTEARRRLKDIGVDHDALLIGIHPGASKKEKLWSVDKYVEVMRFLVDEHKAQILLFTTKKERPFALEIARHFSSGVHLLADLKLRDFAGVLKSCDLFLGLDSGPTHMAEAIGVPTIALYGPNSPEFAAPYKPKARFLSIYKDNFGCRPCEYGSCGKIGQRPTCMEAISSQEVASMLKKALDEVVRS